MNEDRIVQLYEYRREYYRNGSNEWTTKKLAKYIFKFTTLAAERQYVDDLAKKFDLRQGEGHATILEMTTKNVLKKLEFEPR